VSFIFIFLILLTLYYIFVVSVLFIGTLKLKPISKSYKEPFVSVIVAARNEEKFIGKCIESLLKQNYPESKYEIIIVNDRSTDNTSQIVESYQKSCSNLFGIDVKSDPIGMAGKQNAIRIGLENAKGSIILTTDADCKAKPSWIKTLISYFDDKTGMVIGFPVTHEKQSKSIPFFTKLQSLDLVHLLNCATGIIGWRKPLSAIGNNMAYRPEIVSEIGGMKSLGISVSDDAALVCMVGEKTDWYINAARNSDAVIFTRPVKNFWQFFKQRRRWLISGYTDSPKWGIAALQLIFLFYFLIIVSIPVGVFLGSGELLLAVAGSFSIKMLIDLIPAFDISRKLNRLELLKYFIPYQFFQLFYGVFICLGSIIYKKVEWKDQSY